MFHFDENRFNSHFACCDGVPVSHHCHEPHNHHCTGGYPPHRPKYTMSEEVEHTSAMLTQTITNVRKFQERMTAEFESLCAKITNDNVYFKTAMNEAFKSTMNEIQNEINTFESNVDNTVTLFQNGTEQNITEKISAFDSRFTELAEKLEKDFNEFRTFIVEQLNVHANEVNTKFIANGDRITALEANTPPTVARVVAGGINVTYVFTPVKPDYAIVITSTDTSLQLAPSYTTITDETTGEVTVMFDETPLVDMIVAIIY